jgi:hypothetical protein
MDDELKSTCVGYETERRAVLEENVAQTTAKDILRSDNSIQI